METKKGEKMDRRVRKTRAQLRAGLARLMQQKNIKEITVKELVDEIDINRSTFYLHYTDIYQMLQSIEGELMEDILEAIKEHPLDPGMKEEGYSFAIQLFRILAANKDFCAALWKRLKNWSRTLFCRNFLRCSHRMSTTSNTPTLSASTAAWG